MPYPDNLKYLRFVADSCELIGDDEACRKVYDQLNQKQKKNLLSIYAKIIKRNHKEALDQWIEEEDSHESAEAGRILTMLDYMVRNDLIPTDLPRITLVEWDDRSHDDSQNEW